jgi:hypothetical protein
LIIKLLIIQLLPPFSYFDLVLWFKYSAPPPILKHPQIILFP